MGESGDRNPLHCAGAVEVVDVREDEPITRLRTTVARGDGVVAVDGSALCYTASVDGVADPGGEADASA